MNHNLINKFINEVYNNTIKYLPKRKKKEKNITVYISEGQAKK